MVVGLILGYNFPEIKAINTQLSVGTTSIPIAFGLILMMYPPLAKVDYSLLPNLLKDKKSIGISLLLNWLIGPVFMFVLAILFLRNEPEYMIGLILIGLARCIAMVLVWNDLAGGNKAFAALLVAINSVFQVFTYSFYTWVFINFLPQSLGLASAQINVSLKDVALSVFIYLGIPFILGYLSRLMLVKTKGEQWFRYHFIPKISPITLYALLFTIVLMFSLKGDQILDLPQDVLHIALPMMIYFIVMFLVSFILGKYAGFEYDKNVSVAFTATGNNFELAIAVAIAVFGVESKQAFVGVVGPLIEVPALILLVELSYVLKQKLYKNVS